MFSRRLATILALSLLYYHLLHDIITPPDLAVFDL
jgi:hypothetical protein